MGTFCRSLSCLFGPHDQARDGEDYVVHASVHEILEKDFLRAFLLVHARIIGQVVGDGLVTVRKVSRAEGRVHHFHRSLKAAF